MMEGIPTRKQPEIVSGMKKPEKQKSLSGVSETIKAFLRAGLITALLTYNSSVEAFGQQRQTSTAQNPENNRGDISAPVYAGTLSVEKKESLPVNAETIKGYVFSDDHERFFLSQGGVDSYFTPDDVKVSADHGSVPITSIEKFGEEQKTKEIILTHTHPIETYSNFYISEDVKKMQSGELKSSPMAPSTVDFQGIATTYDSLGKKGIKMNGKVFDATGVWEYKVSNKNIDKFNKYKALVVGEMLEIVPRIIKSLSKEEKETLSKVGDIHQDKIIQTLKENPKTAALGEKIEKLLSAELDKIADKYADIFEAMDNLNTISYFIVNYSRLYKNSSPAEGAALGDLITKYKLEAAKIGFEIEYTPR